MTTIECTATIDETHRAVLQFPDDVLPGTHRLMVVIQDAGGRERNAPLEPLPSFNPGPWPAGLSFRREDIYGHDGR